MKKPAVIETVALAEVALAQSSTVANLMQLYQHDFSEFADIGTDHGEVASDGRFVYDYLESYWQEAGRIPLVIQADGRLAGFTLVNQWSALDRPLDHSVAEFFILRKYRRAKVGLRAARVLFERLPGRWEVPVAWYNEPALSFWRRAIPAAVSGRIEKHAGDGERWIGTVLCFDTRP
jgi:predicted acetyltransferase